MGQVLAVEEGLLQQRQQLLAVHVVRVQLQGLARVLVGLLEVAHAVGHEGRVVEGLEGVRTHLAGRVEARLGEVELLSPHLKHGDVVEGFSVLRVHRHRHLEGLVGQTQVPQRDADVADVVPHVRHLVVVRDAQRAVEAAQRHVVLRGVEAAQADVVPHLGVVDAHLQQASVVADAHLRLVRVEEVCSQAGDGLHVGGVQHQHLLVVHDGVVGVVQQVVDAGQAQQQARLAGELLRGLGEQVQAGVGHVHAQVHVTEVQIGVDDGLDAQRRLQLLLCLPQQPQLEVTLAQPGLPPPAAELVLLGGLRAQLQRLAGVVLHVQQVVRQHHRQPRATGVFP
mmetsp:Transcript_24928/g.34202  ORF Transcript_24928/g.34202 Transcript_24928/m.34202 type:complete len:338 (+) Transcript_24928:90-1103(+)